MMATKPKKFKKEHFESVKNFLKTHGTKTINENNLTSYSYKGNSINLILGEFLKGNGCFIQSPSLLVVFYSKPQKIVKKYGFYEELEKYSKNLEKIHTVRTFLHKKIS